MILEFAVVGLGSFLGSCLRFAITRISNHDSLSFPFGTLLANVIAGIAIGFIMALEQQSVLLPPKTKMFLTTGLLGGLSTFSTFSFETIRFFEQGKTMLAIGNILLNLGFSLLGVLFGMYLSRLIFSKP